MYDDITYETRDGLATVRLARPQVRNALRSQTLTELQDALATAAESEDVSAVVVAADGPAFCAGADFSFVEEWQQIDAEAFDAELSGFQAVILQLRQMQTPSIAAIDGPAVGAGCDIALACDVRFVSERAQFIEGFVNIGLLSGDGGAWLLPRLIGESRAKRHLLTGDPIRADDAVEWGLAIRSDEDDIEADAVAFAERIRELPMRAVELTNELSNLMPESLEKHLDRATTAQWECVNSEGHRAWLESITDDS